MARSLIVFVKYFAIMKLVKFVYSLALDDTGEEWKTRFCIPLFAGEGVVNKGL